MPTIKKIGILVILIILALSSAAADEEIKKYGFSVSPLLGFLYGQGEEIVYKYPDNDKFLSQLLWDMKPLFFAGINANFGPRDPFLTHGFTAGASLKFGLPVKTGIMEDRDWDNHQYDYLTHYSRHDAYSRFTFLADLSAGYSWRLADFLSISAVGEFSFMRLSWSGKDGYTQHPPKDPGRDYPEWNEGIQKIDSPGTVINYSQNWFILSPGLALKWKINRLFSLDGKFSYSPLVYIYARDDHFYQNGTIAAAYLDPLLFGHYFNLGGRFAYTLTPGLELSLSVSYRRIFGLRGNSYVSDPVGGLNIFYYSGTDAGAGYSALESSLSVKFLIWEGNYRNR